MRIYYDRWEICCFIAVIVVFVQTLILCPLTPSPLLFPNKINNTFTSRKPGFGGGGDRSGGDSGRKDRLYLPAFLMGYCASGPGILAKGATFAIHVSITVNFLFMESTLTPHYLERIMTHLD